MTAPALTPELAPFPASSGTAACRATCPASRSEPSLTHALVESLPPRGETRNNTTRLVALFEKNTLHEMRSFGLYTKAETQKIADHQINASLFSQYVYVCTTTAGSHSSGRNNLNIFKYVHGGHESPSSGALEVGRRPRDDEPKKARFLRVGSANNICPCL